MGRWVENTEFVPISRKKVKYDSNLHKQQVFESLLARFGSRRALIEELDRLTRLSMLKPRNGRLPLPGERVIGIQNQPNPQWREIDTPSLLISGEKHSPRNGHTVLHHVIHVEAVVSNSTRRCSNCGIAVDDRTPGCKTCENRHRRRSQR